jgi:hypothetical protein
MEGMWEATATTLCHSFMRNTDRANAFSKQSRYETAIERSLRGAHHKLQRLWATRQAEGNVPPPVAAEVEVSGISAKSSENGLV